MPYNIDQFANFAKSTIAGGQSGVGSKLLNTDVQIHLQPGDGAKFPSTSFMAMIGSFAGYNELVRVTGVTGDVMTVQRGQEGTSAQQWNVNTSIAEVATAGTFNDIWTYLQEPYVNARMWGATGDGVIDDTAAIQRAINNVEAAGGGCVVLPYGTYLISYPLGIGTSGTKIRGAARDGTILAPAANFSGSSLFAITADYCGAEDLTVSPVTASMFGNPLTTGFAVTGGRHFHARDLEFFNLNGYCISVTATTAAANTGAMLDSIHVYQCAGGINLVGHSASNYATQAWLSNINVEQIVTLDGVHIEDSNDVLITNINGAVLQAVTANSVIHIKGGCSSIYINNPDIGIISSSYVAPIVLIESGSSGSAKRVSAANGVIQGGVAGLEIDAGTEMWFTGIDFCRTATYGVRVTGAASDITFNSCVFSSNGQYTSSARYDFSHETTGHTRVLNSTFRTSNGTGSGQTDHVFNYTGGNLQTISNYINGTGYSTSNIFSSSSPGFIARGNIGFNPVGNVSVTVGSSPYSVPKKAYDVTYYVTGGTVSAITVDGVNIGVTSGPVRVPAQSQMIITHTGAPTVVGYGE